MSTDDKKQDYTVGRVVYGPPIDGTKDGVVLSGARTLREIECVRACEGMADPGKEVAALKTALAEKDAEIERLKARLEWRANNEGSTHWTECYMDHYHCAMDKIDKLMRENEFLIRLETAATGLSPSETISKIAPEIEAIIEFRNEQKRKEG